MRILAIDIGTGTQDILLFDTDHTPENSLKMVMPSPTMMIARQVKEATRQGIPIALHGVMMGGGPSTWTIRDHVNAGYAVFCTPEAARTFDDNLDVVTEMGITLVSEDELAQITRSRSDVLTLRMGDFDYPRIANAFAAFGHPLELDGVAAAVFDHGNAPPHISDRLFRFDYLTDYLKAGTLSSLAFKADDAPAIMTRLHAVVESHRTVPALEGIPLMVMDTAPAAILGASLDPMVQTRLIESNPTLIANIGNMHTLAFRFGESGIEGLFEHHTGEITLDQLDDLLAELATGTLTHKDVFEHKGHGAILYSDAAQPIDMVAVTGPRRKLMDDSRHPVYQAVPFGDMMLAGSFGLIRAWADIFPDDTSAVMQSLNTYNASAPWETL